MPPFYWHLSFILIGYNSVLLDWGFIVSFRCLCISICKILKMAYVTSVYWRVFHEHLQCLPQSDCLLGYLFSFIFIVIVHLSPTKCMKVRNFVYEVCCGRFYRHSKTSIQTNIVLFKTFTSERYILIFWGYLHSFQIHNFEDTLW